MPSLGAKISYTYNNRQQVEKITMGSNGTVTNTYDGLNRKTGKSIDTPNKITYNYSYQKQNVNTTRINEVRIQSGANPAYSPCALGTYSYKYDANGNITEIWRGGAKQYAYTYDGLNQLTSEEDVFNNKKIEYTYLKGGNFDTKVTTDLTTGTSEMVDYWYDDDHLIIYGEDEDLTFDEIGNPLKYRDGISFTWQYGRSLKQTKNSKYMIGYDYDDNGLRTGKYTFDKKTGKNAANHYYYDGGKLIGMDQGDYHLMFFYDENGTPVRLTKKLLDGTEYVYYYITNLQGDVTGLTNVSGELLTNYTYDAWGTPVGVTNYDTGKEITSETDISVMQPLRYRGYVYDNETGFYYLQSRYYDPVVGRFINTDSAMGVNSDMSTYNLYAYCGNNPVSRYDTSGMFWKELVSGIVHVGNTLAVLAGIDTAALGAPFLMMKKDRDGIYHARKYCWQIIGGYNDFFDSMFDFFTSMEPAKFEFSYNDQNFILWAWKGDYINLGAGAEMGIYTGGDVHWFADPRLSMVMAVALYTNDEKIFEYGPIDTWWITGFNPKYLNYSASDLTAYFIVWFPNQDMFDAFWAAHGFDRRWRSFQTCKAMFRF